jgi:hypothetical protein
LNPYEIITRRAEEAISEYYGKKNKQDKTRGLSVSAKDGILDRILECVSWLDRMPGSEQKKSPYTRRIWHAYLAVQEGSIDDKTTIPEILGGRRFEYIEDQPDEPSIVDSGIGTGGMGYASIKLKDVGTSMTKGKEDPYWKPRKPKKCRTLEGEEKQQAWREYLASIVP